MFVFSLSLMPPAVPGLRCDLHAKVIRQIVLSDGKLVPILQTSEWIGSVAGLETLNCEILRRQEAEAHVQALSEAMAEVGPMLEKKDRLCHILQRLHIAHSQEHYWLLGQMRGKQFFAPSSSSSNVHHHIARRLSILERRHGIWCDHREGHR